MSAWWWPFIKSKHIVTIKDTRFKFVNGLYVIYHLDFKIIECLWTQIHCYPLRRYFYYNNITMELSKRGIFNPDVGCSVVATDSPCSRCLVKRSGILLSRSCYWLQSSASLREELIRSVCKFTHLWGVWHLNLETSSSVYNIASWCLQHVE